MRFLTIPGLLLLVCSLFPTSGWAEPIAAWVLQRSDPSETIVTTSPEEKAALEKDGWVVDVTGQLEAASVEGSGPLYRLFRPGEKGTDRVLETDVKQIPVWEKAGFRNEGIVGYVAAADGPGRLAVIQYAQGERRMWAISESQQAKLKAAGWARQGTHFWLWPAAAK